LGVSVAINGSGTEISAGAPFRNFFTGAVYIFNKPADGWASETQSAELTASDGAEWSFFGWSVAVSGTDILVGASQSGISAPGLAYIFGPSN